MCIVGRVRNVEDRRIDTKRQQSHHDTTVDNHTTTPQYSNQRQPNIKNSSIDSITQHEYFEIILEKVLFNTVTNRIRKGSF